MQYIFDNSEKLDIEDNLNIKLNENEDWQIDILNQFKGNTEQLICFELNGDGYFTGSVEKVSKTDFVFRCVGKMGEDEGTVIYRNEDITAFKINDIGNRKRKMLYDWRKSSV